MREQIVPPVNPAATIAISPAIAQDVAVVQGIVRSDRTVIVAAIVHVAVLLAAYFGLHLDAQQIAVIGSIVAGGLGLLLQMHFTVSKPVAKKK